MRFWTLVLTLIACTAFAADNKVKMFVSGSVPNGPVLVAGTGSTGTIKCFHHADSKPAKVVSVYVNNLYVGSFTGATALMVYPALGTHSVRFSCEGVNFPMTPFSVSLTTAKKQVNFGVKIVL